jgi:TonB-linked SusC/RagA family outer membrane protein
MRERRPKKLRSHGFSLGLLLMLLIASVGVNAQSRQIKGFVKDEAGKVLPGATITIKGTKKVTSADPNGMFSIDAEKGNSLEVSFVGFVTQDIVVGDQTNLIVSLVPQFNSLNEVVVVGYGTQKKENLTGSVAVVNVQDAGKRVTNDVARALQGQVAGVQVNGSGVPGDGVSIRIRGVSSLNNNNPLYIIDGVQTQTPYDFPVGDIESIQVIKDGSAGAIYGFQGANGVILITTKKGKNGPLKINYNAYYGRQYNPKKLSVTDRTQYQQIADAAETNAGLSLAPGNDPSSPSYITNVNTDWQKENFTTGSTQNHELTFSGGNESTTYNLAFGYYNQSGTVTAGPNYRRYNMSGNLQGKKGILSYGAKMAFTEAYYKNLAYPRLHGTGNEVVDMITAIPTMPVYDPSREGGYGGVDQNTQRAISLNVIGVNNLIQNNSQHDRFLGAAWVGLEFFKNFKYLLNVTFDRTDFRNFYFEPTYDLGWFYPSTSAYHSDGRGENYTALIENTLSYKFSVHKNNVELLAGTSYRRDAANTITGTATNLTQPYSYSFDNVSDQSNTSLFGNSAERKFYSPIFGRLNYDYAGKYLLTANYRRDGSSQLRPENRYGNFAGASVGWILTKETIFHLPDAITNLKLRAGYGVQGNINSLTSWYPYQTIVNSNASYVFGNTLATGTTQTQVFDQTNKWEQKKSTNIGLDLNMFHDRLAFTAEYYNNKINGILLAVPIPISVGAINTPTVNAASFTNKGLEFTVTYHSKNTGSFHYDISANASTLKNKVLSLGQGNNPIYGAFSKTAVGGEVGELFGYQTEGIFQNANDLAHHATQVGAGVGDVKFKDLNGDGIITDADRTYLGSAIPKLYYGFNFNVAYKNFDATLFIQGNYGSKIANGVYQALMTGQYGNQSTDELNYWTPTNTNTNVPRPIIGDPNGNGRNSDRYIQSGNFTRLQTAQIGYTIPTDLLNRTHVFKTFRVYLSGQNLATITGYKGYDPDFGNDGTLNRGFDYGSFPNPRTFLVGVQVGL